MLNSQVPNDTKCARTHLCSRKYLGWTHSKYNNQVICIHHHTCNYRKYTNLNHIHNALIFGWPSSLVLNHMILNNQIITKFCFTWKPRLHLVPKKAPKIQSYCKKWLEGLEELTGLFDLPQRSAKMVEGRGRSKGAIGRRREPFLGSNWGGEEERRKNGKGWVPNIGLRNARVLGVSVWSRNAKVLGVSGVGWNAE